jgi:hypothetical protein
LIALAQGCVKYLTKQEEFLKRFYDIFTPEEQKRLIETAVQSTNPKVCFTLDLHSL